eukprot:6478348-Amphidinium_carterae.2
MKVAIASPPLSDPRFFTRNSTRSSTSATDTLWPKQHCQPCICRTTPKWQLAVSAIKKNTYKVTNEYLVHTQSDQIQDLDGSVRHNIYSSIASNPWDDLASFGPKSPLPDVAVMHMHNTTPAITANETYTVTRVIVFNKRESNVNRFLHSAPMTLSPVSPPQTIDGKAHKHLIEEYLWNTPDIYVSRARMNQGPLQ